MPKYVGLKTLQAQILRGNVTLLEGDIEDSIPKFKDEIYGALFMHEAANLLLSSPKKGLIDDLRLT